MRTSVQMIVVVSSGQKRKEIVVELIKYIIHLLKKFY